MRTVRIWNDDPSDRQISEICDCIRSGEVIICPTDTLYGIACSALDVKAVERVCRIKGINPEKSNLSILCGDISQASRYARIDNAGYRLLKDNTPGPFTFIFKASSALPKTFRGRKAVGIRIPDCRTMRKVCGLLDYPLMTASIDFESDDYAVSPSLIAERYEGETDLMVEGPEGATEPSTVVDCTGSVPEVIRQGKGVLV